jgi:hypothetical protein
MSALEATVRVNSEKQTLILAGEPEPRRFAYDATSSQRPLNVVATPVDDPVLIAPSAAVGGGSFAVTPPPRNFGPPASFAARGNGYNAAHAYARTQQSDFSSTRSALIDTYA